MPGLEAHEEHGELLRGLRQTPKRIPVSYLYDARGSSLYEQITELKSYYPYTEERHLLQTKASTMVQYIPEDAVIVELGCGPATKTCILLKAVARLHSRLEFVGIDVSQQFLDEARENIDDAMASLQKEASQSHPQEISWKLHMVCAEYLDGMRTVRRMFPGRTLVVLWLGSSVGNLEDPEARPFFRELLHVSGPQTHVLLATDLWKSRSVLQLAYDEPEGVTGAFIKNGLRHALRAVGVGVGDREESEEWEYEVVVCPRKRRVEMWVRCKERIEVNHSSIVIEAGERVFMEISRKFTRDDVAALAQSAGLVLFDAWSTDLYGMQLLVSAQEALRLSWGQSDAFFRSLPDWASTPIEFRRPFSFYYGHLAAFTALKLVAGRSEDASPLDTMYSRGIDPMLLDPTQCHSHPEAPKEWPDEHTLKEYVAKTRQDILAFLASHVYAGNTDFQKVVGGMRFNTAMRGVVLGMEHEMMHLETLAYMKAQEDIALWRTAKHQPLANGSVGEDQMMEVGYANGAPTGEVLANRKTRKGVPAESGKENLVNGAVPVQSKTPVAYPAMLPVVECDGTGAVASPLVGETPKVLAPPTLDVVVPPGSVSMGVSVAQDSAVRFVWDNEGPQVQPQRVVQHALAVSSRPVTVGEFHSFVARLHGYSRPELWQSDDWLFLQTNPQSCPATWALGPSKDGKQDYWVYDIHSVDAAAAAGKVGEMRPWREVAGSPVLVSLAEAEAYCKALGGGARIMSEEEWNRIAQFCPEEHAQEVALGVGPTASMEVDGAGAHMPAVSHGWEVGLRKKTPRGQASEHKAGAKGVAGASVASSTSAALLPLQKSIRQGGWEWTRTPFEPFPGFESMPDYPEYSTDFFDGMHFVLKGSSPATHPAMLRDSFRNFYQRQYPYVFAKFRVCREI